MNEGLFYKKAWAGKEPSLRPIAKNEIVLEYDNCTRKEGKAWAFGSWKLLDKEGYNAEAWDHGGKSPHIHIKDIKGLERMNKKERHDYKLKFIKKYSVNDNFDNSLAGKHLIAAENEPHFKIKLKGKKYGIKKYLGCVNEGEKNTLENFNISIRQQTEQPIITAPEKYKIKPDNDYTQHPIARIPIVHKLKPGDRNNKLWYQIKCLFRDSNINFFDEKMAKYQKAVYKKQNETFPMNTPPKNHVFSIHCINTFCDDNNIKKPIFPEDNKPIVHLPQPGHCMAGDFVEDVTKHLMKHTLFYRKGDNTIVEIVKGEIVVVSPARMITIIDKVCTTIKQGKDDIKIQSATEIDCRILLASSELRNKLRKIEKVLKVPMPILKNGNITIPQPGYNTELKLFLEESDIIIDETMDVAKAKKILADIHKDFCFKDKNDYYKALLSLITPALRGVFQYWYSRTPVFIQFANRERAGKDCLAGIRSIIYEGTNIEEPPLSTGKYNMGKSSELRKKILASLRNGKKILHFANNKGTIDNAVLEQAITAECWTDRLLGKNKTVQFNNDLEFSLSGNIGTLLSADLTNRSIIINLFLDIEDANARTFTYPTLHNYIKENRNQILSAICSLINNWYNAGMPKSGQIYSSFPEWGQIAGGVLEMSRYENPIGKDNIVLQLDSELEDMKILYNYFFEHYGETYIKKYEIRNKIIELQGTDDDLGIFGELDLDSKSGQISFGKMIDRYIGREINSIKIIQNPVGNIIRRRPVMFTKRKIKKTKINFF